MKTQHTPGPWTASFNGNDDTRIFAESVADSPHCIAKVNSLKFRGLESCANAHLIAAAPELLSELQSLVDRFWEGRPKQNVRRDYHLMVRVEAARTAIRKATNP